MSSFVCCARKTVTLSFAALLGAAALTPMALGQENETPQSQADANATSTATATSNEPSSAPALASAAGAGEAASAVPGAPIAHILVTANAAPTDERRVAASASVVDAEDIERRQARTLMDALREVPGLQMGNTGGPGSPTSFFLRGANHGSVVFMVDGAPLNHPWDASHGFEANSLFNLENVERVEVVRGPQSMIHGSDAMAGVVNIVTKKGEGPPTASAMFEAGSRGTVISKVETSGGGERFDYSFGGAVFRTDGFNSSVNDASGERDHYDNESLSLRLGANPAETLRLDFFARYANSTLHYDDDYSPAQPVSDRESLTLRPQATLSLFGDRWVQTAGFSYGRHEYDTDDRVGPGGTEQHTRAYSSRFDYRSDIRLLENNTLSLGFDHTREWYATDQSTPWTPAHVRAEATRLTGVYLEDGLSFFDRLFITLGARNDHHSGFGDHTTYRATAAYLFSTGTKVKASYGTGFKAPTLYQLHDTTWGGANPDLRPEKNKGWEVGFEQELADGRFAFGATYFDNRYKDLIDWPWPTPPGSPAGYININRARMKGVESFVRWRLSDNLDFSVGHTYLDAKNEATGMRLGRRARNSLSAGVHWRFLERGDLDVRYRAMDARNDSNAGGARLGGYGVVDLALSWKVNENLTLTGRAENLFDKNNEYASGYRNAPATYFAGLRLSF